MDTTYFGRNFGVMVFKDSLTGTILLTQFVRQETNALYLKGVEEEGLLYNLLSAMEEKDWFNCLILFQYNIVNFIKSKQFVLSLTKKPKLEASIELWQHTLHLTNTDKESFIGGLDLWYIKWKDFLDEERIDEKGKIRYVHKKLRSAYRSLKNNLYFLFVWYDNIELQIPNTTNAIDGHFADLKNKLRNHNGLSIARKMKFINEFFKA